MQATPRQDCRQTGGFTLVELLIVILIIVVLISILIPTVSRVRTAAHSANTKNQLQQIVGAIERYYGDQHQYPGPLGDEYLQTAERQTGAPAIPIYDANGGAVMPRANYVTQSENLVLGLFGGLKWVNSGGSKLCYDPQMIGRGMMSMNPAQPRKFAPYIDDLKMLSPYDLNSPPTQYLNYSDGAGMGSDSPIPEIVDKFPNSMPFLYLKAHPGKDGVIANDDPAPPVNASLKLRQYNLSDAYAYTRPDVNGNYIGEGKKIRPSDYTPSAYWGTINPSKLPHGFKEASAPSFGPKTIQKGEAGKTYVYPYDAWAYFRDPGTPYLVTGSGTLADDAANTPRAKDRFILISAGADRVYGTADDICSFGDVQP